MSSGRVKRKLVAQAQMKFGRESDRGTKVDVSKPKSGSRSGYFQARLGDQFGSCQRTFDWIVRDGQ